MTVKNFATLELVLEKSDLRTSFPERLINDTTEVAQICGNFYLVLEIASIEVDFLQAQIPVPGVVRMPSRAQASISARHSGHRSQLNKLRRPTRKYLALRLTHVRRRGWPGWEKHSRLVPASRHSRFRAEPTPD